MKTNFLLTLAVIASLSAPVFAQVESPIETLPPLERARLLLQAINREEFDATDDKRKEARAEVIAILDKLLAGEPKNAQAWYLRGVAEDSSFFTSLAEAQKAIPFFDKALALDDRLAEAHYRRGRDTLITNSYSKTPEEVEKRKAIVKRATADFDRAVALGLKNADLFFARAEVRRTAQNFPGALSDLSEALALKPQNHAFLDRRAEVLEKLKRWREAVADRTVLLGKKSYTYVNRARDYVEMKDWNSAFADFDKAIVLSPKSAYLYIDRAKAYRIKGDKVRAFADYMAAHALDAKYPAVKPDLSDYALAEAVRF